jgi:hypothetical protein
MKVFNYTSVDFKKQEKQEKRRFSSTSLFVANIIT